MPQRAIRIKANRLGRRLAPGGGGGGGGIRKIGRSMKDPFDVNAWDGDNDGVVQEGTMWERPAVPGINTNLPGMRHTRNKPKDLPLDDIDRVRNPAGLRSRADRNVKKFLGRSFEEASDEFLGSPGAEANYGINSEAGEKVRGLFNEIEDLVKDVDFDRSVSLDQLGEETNKQNEIEPLVDEILDHTMGLRDVGAPSEKNPGGTPKYWRQPLPGREKDPGGPQTLGEENIGFRRDGMSGMRSGRSSARPSGARSRQRDATTDRAAAVRGMQSRRKPISRAGAEIVDPERDGAIWKQLTDEQRRMVAEAARGRMMQLQRLMTGNHGQRGQGKAERGNNAWGAAIFDGSVRADSADPYGDFSDYILSPNEVQNLLGTFEEFIDGKLKSNTGNPVLPTQGDLEREGTNRKRLDELIVLAKMMDIHGSSGSRKKAEDEHGEGGAFALLEHLHGIGRSAIWKDIRKNHGNEAFPTRKKLGDTSDASTVFEFEGGFSKEEVDAMKATRGSRGRVSKAVDTFKYRVLRQDQQRKERRERRRARRAGTGRRATEATADRAKPAEWLKRQQRRVKRKLQGKRGQSEIRTELDRKRSQGMLKRDKNGVIQVDERFIDRIATIGKNHGLRKEGKTTSTNTTAANNPFLLDIWENGEHNALPVVIDLDEAQHLIDEGWTVQRRGMGANSGRYSDVYRDSDDRFTPHTGRSVYGIGEYWAPEEGGHWGGYGDGILGFVDPEAKMISSTKAAEIKSAHAKIQADIDGRMAQEAGDPMKNMTPDEWADAVEEALKGSDLDSEMGQVVTGFIKQYRASTPDQKEDYEHAWAFLSRMPKGDPFYYAGVLGYDGIDVGPVQLVSNRGAMVVLDKVGDGSPRHHDDILRKLKGKT
jgi:predicted DNA-binding transcriptional regulator AlpA